MHFLYCIIAGLIVCLIGVVVLMIKGKHISPEEEKEQSRIVDIDEDITENIRYDWREKERVN